MRMRLVSIVAVMALVATVAVSGCSPQPTAPVSPPQVAPPTIREAADAVLRALEAKDGAALAALVHAEKGVRFSPYAYVDVDKDVTLSRSEVETFWSDTTVRTWGAADGSGEPIKLTCSDYYSVYILDRDFSTATVSVNQDLSVGNTINNAASAYPGADRVEYYIASSIIDGEPSSDWAALRLVFEPVDGRYYLVGVIHDEWTI